MRARGVPAVELCGRMIGVACKLRIGWADCPCILLSAARSYEVMALCARPHGGQPRMMTRRLTIRLAGLLAEERGGWFAGLGVVPRGRASAVVWCPGLAGMNWW